MASPRTRRNMCCSVLRVLKAIVRLVCVPRRKPSRRTAIFDFGGCALPKPCTSLEMSAFWPSDHFGGGADHQQSGCCPAFVPFRGPGPTNAMRRHSALEQPPPPPRAGLMSVLPVLLRFNQVWHREQRCIYAMLRSALPHSAFAALFLILSLFSSISLT